ncbi:MAG: SDR family oxidoreductase [Flavobacteriales bacterium]|jgi:short-subunit dehydrogenase
MTKALTDQLVWITGGSSGIGEQLAYACSSAGARLVLSARNAAALERVRASCQDPSRVLLIPMDLTSTESIQLAASRVLAEAGPPDVLIHNGGRSQRSRALSSPLALDRELMEVNYFGPVALTKLVVPEMLRNGGGLLVVMSSLAGKWGFYERSAYAAAKHALHGFFETLRLENEDAGLRVSMVTPGFIATDISRHAADATGQPTGEMDANQARGMPPEVCARIILRRALAGDEEFAVGGKELIALWIHRYFPRLFGRLIRRQSPRGRSSVNP